MLKEKIDLYVDESANLYIRLGIKELLNDEFVINPKKCIHLKFKIEAYPSNKQNAIRKLEKLLR